MTENPQLSGVDLARVALRAAKVAAQKNGGGRTAQPKPRTTRVVRRDGREPMGLGAAIGALVTERAWELPAAGATLRARWEAIAPRARRARRRRVVRRRLRPAHRVPGVGGLGDEAAPGAGPHHRGRQRFGRPDGRPVPADPGARRGAGTRAGRRRSGARDRARRAAA